MQGVPRKQELRIMQVPLNPVHHIGEFAGVDFTILDMIIEHVDVALCLILGPAPFGCQFSSVDEPIIVGIISGHNCCRFPIGELVG